MIQQETPPNNPETDLPDPDEVLEELEQEEDEEVEGEPEDPDEDDVPF